MILRKLCHHGKSNFDSISCQIVSSWEYKVSFISWTFDHHGIKICLPLFVSKDFGFLTSSWSLSRVLDWKFISLKILLVQISQLLISLLLGICIFLSNSWFQLTFQMVFAPYKTMSHARAKGHLDNMMVHIKVMHPTIINAGTPSSTQMYLAAKKCVPWT